MLRNPKAVHFCREKIAARKAKYPPVSEQSNSSNDRDDQVSGEGPASHFNEDEAMSSGNTEHLDGSHKEDSHGDVDGESAHADENGVIDVGHSEDSESSQKEDCQPGANGDSACLDEVKVMSVGESLDGKTASEDDDVLDTEGKEDSDVGDADLLLDQQVASSPNLQSKGLMSISPCQQVFIAVFQTSL